MIPLLLLFGAGYLIWQHYKGAGIPTSTPQTPQSWIDPQKNFTPNTATARPSYTAPAANPSYSVTPPPASGVRTQNPGWQPGRTVTYGNPMPDTRFIESGGLTPEQAARMSHEITAAAPPPPPVAPSSTGGYWKYLSPGSYAYSLTPREGFTPGVIPTREVAASDYV